MPEHRWSGWPGAWCLDCGCEDPREIALAKGEFVICDDCGGSGFSTPGTGHDNVCSQCGGMGEVIAEPDPKLMECPEPGSNRFNPYTKPNEQ